MLFNFDIVTSLSLCLNYFIQVFARNLLTLFTVLTHSKSSMENREY